MSDPVDKILQKEVWRKEDLIPLLGLRSPASQLIFSKALAVKSETVGRNVFFRGLIEYSNACSKNCYYCGIRSHNTRYNRYQLSDQEVMEAALYAWRNRFASIVIQSGENSSGKFIAGIERLLRDFTRQTNGELHVTLSLGEQERETYCRWHEAGAHRYLLRVETSNPDLYKRLHPPDKLHDFDRRTEALSVLKEIGYQVGTGVMIGLPFQTTEDLAEDLLFFEKADIDMVGMGPYIEHADTPLYKFRDQLPSLQDRFELTLNMIALLRIMMPNINIAATTALQAIDPKGREKALLAGANVMMPNLTPIKYKQNYLLYNDKPGIADDAEESKEAMEKSIREAGETIGYGEWGDSKHYELRRTRDEGR